MFGGGDLVAEQDEKTQILKSREDQNPVVLQRDPTTALDEPSFLVEGTARVSWAQGGQRISADKLRKRIEPWLTALCQSDHLSLLLGSGLTHAVHHLATEKKLPGMSSVTFQPSQYADRIDAEARRVAEAAGRGRGNIEDDLRVAVDLIRGLEILNPDDGTEAGDAGKLKKILRTVIENFAHDLLGGERRIATAPDERRGQAFNYLVTFLMSFASRSGTRDRLHLFTTNYDRLIEAGADIAGLHLLDRFVGALAPVFRSSRLDLDLHYNPPGIRGEPRYLEGVARFTKLHGSLDWIDDRGAIRRIGVPFGARDLKPYLLATEEEESDANRLMVYPNAAKDWETAGYPYVDLFRDFAAYCCRPNHTLFAYGYSFGDDHINRVIRDMLTIPSTHLVVISYDDPLGRIMALYEQVGRPAQISLLVGDHFGNLKRLVDWYLPKPAIDRTTIRMADLLKARFGAAGNERDAATSGSADLAEEI